MVAREFRPRGETRSLAIARIELFSRVAASACRRTFGFNGGKSLPLIDYGGRTRFEFRLGDELAEILVTGLRGREQGHHAPILHRDFGADTCAQAVFPGRPEKSRRPADAIAIEERHRRQAEMARGLHDVLGIRGPAQKTERAAGVEFDVVQGKRKKGERGKKKRDGRA